MSTDPTDAGVGRQVPEPGRIIPPLGLERLVGEERTRCEKLQAQAAKIVTDLSLGSLPDALNEPDVCGYGMVGNVLAPLPLAERLREARTSFIAEHGELGRIAWSDAFTILIVGVNHYAGGGD